MMGPSRTLLRACSKPFLLAFLGLALLLPTSALGAGWTGFATVPSSGAAATGLKLASDSAGNQVAVWVEQPSPFKVRAAFRPAGGAWGAAQTLDATSTAAPLTDLAVDPAGNFIFLYNETTGAGVQVYSAYLPAGQTSFGNPQAFGSLVTAGPVPRGVAVGFAPDGTAWGVAAYSTSDVGGRRPTGAGSTWTMNSTGLPAGSNGAIDLAVTSDGTPTLADFPAAGGARHTRFNGASWITITTPTGPSGNATGTVRIVPSAGNGTTTIYGVLSTATGLATQSCPVGTAAPTQCTARTDLDSPSAIVSALNPSIAVDPATGNGVVVWTENTAVFSSRRSGGGGAWTAATQIATGVTPAVTFDSLGSAMAVFGDGSNHLQFLQAAGGSAFTPPPLALTDPAQSWTAPALAPDGAGDVMGAWLSSSSTAIQSAVYDVVAPSISSVNVPTGVVTGADRAFDANASDTWSGVTYAWDFGDGSTGSGQSVTHTYGAPGSYTARLTATDAAGNASSQTQAVDVTTPPVMTGLSRPIAGQTVNVEPVSGVVLVRVPGSSKFVPLVAPAQIREGSIIDARKGRVRITIDNGRGGLDTAEFYGGIFKFTQPTVKAGQLWFANLYLYAGSFKGCPRAPKNPKVATASGKKAKKQSQNRSVRHLWGSGEGAFRTVGRFSSATVRGTTWLTDDRCNGTLTKVTAGKVGVRDFVLKKTVLVKKGKTYLALAKPAKKSSRR